MKPNETGSWTLEGKQEVNAAITSFGLRCIVFTETLQRRAYPDGDYLAEPGQVELNASEAKEAMKGLRIIARQKLSDGGGAHRVTAQLMVEAYDGPSVRRSLFRTLLSSI